MQTTAARLPRTTSLQRVRSPRLWWLAIVIALVVNLALVVLLAHISHLHQPVAEVPLTVRTLRQVEAEPPLMQEPVVAQAAAPSEAVVIALPSLDLPAVPLLSELRLPTFANLATDALLPHNIPAFAALGMEPIQASGPGSKDLPAFDTAAVREGAFDLDRFYPLTARARGVTGSSRIRLTIDASGRVTAVEVLASAPADVFDAACERLARSLQFRPATAAGQPVASIQETIITWTLK